jgi:4-alpha-glucanotransferase
MYAYRQEISELMAMDDTDRLVAAIFAATMIGKHDNPTLVDFWTSYDACLKEAKARETRAREAASQMTAETLAKLGS